MKNLRQLLQHQKKYSYAQDIEWDEIEETVYTIWRAISKEASSVARSFARVPGSAPR